MGIGHAGKADAVDVLRLMNIVWRAQSNGLALGHGCFQLQNGVVNFRIGIYDFRVHTAVDVGNGNIHIGIRCSVLDYVIVRDNIAYRLPFFSDRKTCAQAV